MKLSRILIVDDQREVSRMLRSSLELSGRQVVITSVPSGEEALLELNQGPIDLLVTDLRLPGLSGLEAAGKITGACRVVFITAYDEYAIKAFEHEALDYLLKPVSRERLEKTVRRLREQIQASVMRPENFFKAMERVAKALQNGNVSPYLHWIKV